MSKLHENPKTRNTCRMTRLALTFHGLREAEGLAPFNAEEFARWAESPLSHGAVYAARFILAVWSGRMGKLSDKPRKTPAKDTWFGIHRWNLDSHWRVGPFDVVDAMGTWDEHHRAAFVAWAERPWFP